jgi:hypothetical protein
MISPTREEDMMEIIEQQSTAAVIFETCWNLPPAASIALICTLIAHVVVVVVIVVKTPSLDTSTSTGSFLSHPAHYLYEYCFFVPDLSVARARAQGEI